MKPPAADVGDDHVVTLRDFLSTWARYKWWGVLAMLLVAAGGYAFVAQAWEEQSTALSILHAKPPKQNKEAFFFQRAQKRNLDGDAAMLRSEATASVVQMFIEVVGGLSDVERYRLRDGSVARTGRDRDSRDASASTTGNTPTVVDPESRRLDAPADSDASYADWLIVDITTGKRLDRFDVFTDVLLIPPESFTVLVDSFWGTGGSTESRNTLRDLARAGAWSLTGSISAEGDWDTETLRVSSTRPDRSVAVYLANSFSVAFVALTSRNERSRYTLDIEVAKQKLIEAQEQLAKAESDVFDEVDAMLGDVPETQLPALRALLTDPSLLATRSAELEQEIASLLRNLRHMRKSLAKIRRDSLTFRDRVRDPEQALWDARNEEYRRAVQELQPDAEETLALRQELAVLRASIDARATEFEAADEALRNAQADAWDSAPETPERVTAEARLVEAEQRYASAISELVVERRDNASRTSFLLTITEQEERVGIAEGDLQGLQARRDVIRLAQDRSDITALIRRRHAQIAGYTTQLHAASEAQLAAHYEATTVDDVYLWQKIASTDTAKRTSVLAPALGVGAFALVVLALVPHLVGLLDTRVRTTLQLSRGTGLPVVVEIPTFRRGERAAALAGEPPERLAAAFAVLAFNVKNLRPTGSHSEKTSPSGIRRGHMVALTSPNQNEGKSFCAFNLALASVRQGLRTAFVIADRHNPPLEVLEALGDEFPFGFSDLVTVAGHDDLEVTYDDVLRPTKIPRLSACVAGTSTMDGAALFESPTFVRFLARLRQDFDIVVIDCPPVLPLVDTVVLARHVDSVVLTARAGGTRRADIAHASAQLRFVDAPVCAAILTFATRSKRSYAAYYHQSLLSFDVESRSFRSERRSAVDPISQAPVPRDVATPHDPRVL